MSVERLYTPFSSDPSLNDSAHAAWQIALEANNLHHAREATASDLAEVLSRSDHSQEEYDDAKEDYAKTKEEFEILSSATATLMPPRAAFEAVIAKQEEQKILDFTTLKVWETMSEEQRELAHRGRKAMAKNKKLAEHGVTEDKIRLLMIEPDSPRAHHLYILIYTGEGIDLGDPNAPHDSARSLVAIRNNEDDFYIDVDENLSDDGDESDDILWDVRDMWDKPYELMVVDALERGIEPPDGNNGEIYTWYSAGESPIYDTDPELLADPNKRIAMTTVNGKVKYSYRHKDGNSRELRFRPSVMLPDL